MLSLEKTPNPSLPDDLLLSCFARVSRLDYPILSLASKSFRSLLASPYLYKTRSSLGRQESCLYVCLIFPPDLNPRWFTLCRKPNQTQTTKKKSSDYVLAKLPIPRSPPSYNTCLVTIGSDIYNIGYIPPLSSVSILDCRSHTWREAPSMFVARSNAVANVLDGKIYVRGGCQYCNNSNWMEVFDPKTQTWDLVSSPGMKVRGSEISKGAVIDGKLYTFGWFEGLFYEPKESRWVRAEGDINLGYTLNSYCVIDNVFYAYSNGNFGWYITKSRCWKILNGLHEILNGLEGIPTAYIKLVDYGGKLAVFWDNLVDDNEFKKKKIWCAVITLEKSKDSEDIWGKVEWCDVVLMVPESCKFLHAIAATV